MLVIRHTAELYRSTLWLLQRELTCASTAASGDGPRSLLRGDAPARRYNIPKAPYLPL